MTPSKFYEQSFINKLTKHQLKEVFKYGSLNSVKEGMDHTMHLLTEKTITDLDALQIFKVQLKYAEGMKDLVKTELENQIRDLQAEKHIYDIKSVLVKNSSESDIKVESSVKYLKPRKPRSKNKKEE